MTHKLTDSKLVKKDTIKILLLSCGTNACYHIAKILKQKFADFFYIVGCDINKKWLIPTCNYLDSFYQSPYSSDEDYYEFILNICQTENIKWILPSFDNDQFLFSSDNQDLKRLGIQSFAINSSLDFYHNKELTNDYLKAIGIPVPKRFSKENVDDETEYFTKPLHGVGSIGISKRYGSDIKQYDNLNCVIQELCFEPEYTLECFLYNKKIYSVARERIDSKSGVCTKTRIFQNKNLERFAYRLAEKTKLPHIFNMQFMHNQQGKYVCTDLNLRPAGGMSLSYAAGWDEVSSLANIMLGQDEETITASVDKKIPEQYIIRHYEDIVTKKVRKRIAFDLDGTLLNSKKRHEIVMADILTSHGINISTSDLIPFKSSGKNNIAWLLSKGVMETEAEKINEEWITLIEKTEYLKLDKLYPDTINVLKQLCTDSDLFLITARKNKNSALRQIKNSGISQYFTDIFVVETCSETPILKALELKKHQISHIIGDTESDCKAASIAGCKFCAVSHGFRNTDYLKQYTSNIYSDLPEAINSIL